MPKSPVPDRYTDLLKSRCLAHLATVNAHGNPEVNPVWFLWDGEHVLLSVKPDTKKYSNLRRNPHVALSIVDPNAPFRYIELRGEVVSFELYEDLTFVNQLSQKYQGTDFQRGKVGEQRYKLTIQVNSWTGQ